MKHLPSSTAHPHRSSLAQAARQAAHAGERLADDLDARLVRRAGDGLPERRWPGRVQPLVGRLSWRAQQLARHGLDLAGQAGSQAQASWSRYASATTGYVARQPMRSVLIAAAVGAGLALLLASRRKRP